MKFLRCFVLAALLACGLYAVASAETTTIMMYMCGTDIEEDCLTDMQELTGANTGSNVRIVVLAGGTRDWSDSRLKDKKLNLFTIQNGSWSSITDWGSSSMGSTATLTRFVTYCWNNYHSDRNMLIMWDHGSTALDGLCFDEIYNDDGLTLSELGSAFSQLKSSLSNFHLDIIGADACLMGSYEMAVTLAPYADYYVASEELEPWLGWYYTNWVKALNANPSMTNRELAVSIVDSYIAGCKKEDPNDYLTLSAIDLSCMSELSGCINSLASTLASQLKSGNLNTISRTVRSMYVFGTFDDAGSDMVDLNDFLTMCASYDSATAQKAKTALQSAVIYNYASSLVPSATGMSIFVPVENSSYVASYLSDYTSSATTGYSTFVSAFASSVSGGSYTFSSGNSGPYQLDSGDYDAGFWSSADNWFCEGGSCYGSGYGYNTSEIVIGGTPIQGSGAVQGGTVSGGSAAGGIVIGGTPIGSSSTQAPAATETVAPAVTAVPETTAALQNLDLEDSYTFSITLTDEDMHYLSYAELVVYQDYSDESGWDLDELGSVRNTWIDWENDKVYASFDGTWPCIGDTFVVMYEQSRTDYGRRCIVPVMLNGTEKTYLVVEYTGTGTEGRILGTSQGWSDNGLPVRGVTPLEIGDYFTPVYPSYFSGDTSESLTRDDMSYQWAVYDDEDFRITWDGTQTVTTGELPDSVGYKLAFTLHDIFGGATSTAFVTFTMK